MISINKLLKLKLPLVLASKSPRRRELLTRLGFDFKIMPSEIDESVDANFIDHAEHAIRLACEKAMVCAAKLPERSIVLGSDTIVVLNETILNKPVDSADAVRMLKLLSGRTHIVYSGVALVDSETEICKAKVQKTEVTFRNLDAEEIEAYVETGSPLDKAGAYGIQDDFGAVFVENIVGCYYNIVGLPLELLYKMLKEFNLEI